MATLSISLLGEFSIAVDGEVITTLTSNKALLLLAYLVMEPRQHQRSELAGLLWPDHAESTARTNLRHILRVLRQSLPTVDGAPEFFLTGQQTLHLNPDVDVSVDAWRFRELLTRCAECDHAALEHCSACMRRYNEAATLYRDDFLAIHKVDESDLFAEWAVIQREGLHRQALDLFFLLTTYYEAQNDNEQALRYAWRQIELEPWREEAHRQLMRILARSGQRTAALAQYAQCKDILAKELAVEPDRETTTLYEQIRTDQFPIRPAQQVSNPPIRTEGGAERLPGARTQDWGEAPIIPYFYGREIEQTHLTQWLLGERCRVLAILGMGGMGKTSLVVAVAKAASAQFDLLFWRSLLNAPPLAELLPPLLQRLVPSGAVQIPTTYHEQMTLLLAQLRAQRCLIIFDNWESILEPGGAGHYRVGYEAYGQLLQRFVHSDHQSCLLLTSRERPEKLGQMEDDRLPVRALRLDGLPVEAGRALLGRHQQDRDAAQVANLVAHYSGNPLALKLVARTIDELFDGDIGAFLEDDAPIFDDIRAVLDEQFNRLTPLEQELLLWLAIEREATPRELLVQNLVRKPSRRELIEALRALERRSLLERNDRGFLLQNVVTEYLTDRLIEQICQEILGNGAQGRQDGQVNAAIEHETAPLSLQHPFTEWYLNRHALFKAQAKEYVRQSQVRLIVQPIVQYLTATLGLPTLITQLGKIRVALQQITAGRAGEAPGYLGGNLLNLFLYMNVDLTNSDFSHLCLWQAFLRGKATPGLDLTGADLAGAAFTYIFGNVQKLQFQAEDELLVVGTSGDRACVWQAKDGALLHAVPIQDPTYSFICFHTESRIAALGGPDYTIVLVDMVTGQIRHTLVGHAAPIWCHLFAATGSWFASGDATGQIYLWDVASGGQLGRLETHAAPITALTFAPGANLLASGDVDGVVVIWRVPDGERLIAFQAHAAEVGALQFVLGSRAIATGSHDHTICLWDLASGELLHRLRGHTQPIRIMGSDAAGEILVSGGEDHFIAVWDTTSGQTRYRLREHAAPLWHLGCRSDGLRVAALDTSETLNVWNLATGQRTEAYPIHHNGIETLAFSPDGKLLTSGGTDGIVYIWEIGDPTAPMLRTRLQGHTRRVKSIVFSADGTTLASGDRRGELRLWSIASGMSRILHGNQEGIMALAFHPSGQILASAGADGNLHLWHVANGQRYKDMIGHTNAITACAFSPDGRRLVSCGFDRTVRLWDVESGVELFTMQAHTNSVQHVAFCPDGERIISSSYDETICLWRAADGKLLTRWSASNLAYISLDLHPAGALVAAGSHDNAIHLLALETGQFLGELSGHTRSVETVHFSPVAVAGTQLLASAGFDETIRLWAVESSQAETGVTVDTATCLAVLRAPGPYTGMKIRDVTGISDAQIASLKALGAVE